jgi:hypothetical protein
LAAILDHFRPKIPVILQDTAGEPVRLSAIKSALDYEIVHPRLSEVEGRPGWLATAPGRQVAIFKLEQIPSSNALLQAVPMDELASAAVIPADQYPAPDNAHAAVFYLKPGRYEVRIEDDEGRRTLGTLTVGGGLCDADFSFVGKSGWKHNNLKVHEKCDVLPSGTARVFTRLQRRDRFGLARHWLAARMGIRTQKSAGADYSHEPSSAA